MAQQKYYTILTEVGKSKIANATVLNEKVQFSKMQLGDGGGSQYEPHEKQTELKNKVWEGSISNVKVDENNPNWIVVETAIPGNSGGFTVREVGLFDDAGELLAVGKYPETYKPVVDDGCVKDLFVRVILMVVNTSAITLKIDPTVILASMKDLNDLRKEVSAKIDTAKTELNSKIDEVRSDLDSIELTAEKVSVKDVEKNFTSVNTEGVLQELAVKDKSLDTKIVSTKSDLTNQFDHFTGEIDNLKQSVSSGKELIATAVTGKDVPTNGSDSFKQMADNIDSIKTKLPIMEDDVGVAEDNEGNVYRVIDIEDKQVYKDPKNKIFKKWSTPFLNYVKNLFMDKNGDVYFTGYSTSTSLYKYTSEGTLVWQYKGLSTLNKAIYDDNDYIYIWQQVTGTDIGNLHKLDLNGNLVWSYQSKNLRDVALDENNSIYIGTNGVDGKILKLDSKGEEIWNRKAPYFDSIKLYDDKNIYYSTWNSSTSGSLVKLDYNGDTIWEYKSPNIPTNDFNSVNFDSKGDVYFISDGSLVKLDYNGDTIWRVTGSWVSLCVTDIGEVYGCLNSYRTSPMDTIEVVMRVNGDGEKVWTYELKKSWFTMLDTLGNIYVTSEKEGNMYGSIIKLTPEGHLLWQYDTYKTYSLVLDNEGGVYVGGNANSNGGLEKIKDNYTLEKVAVLKEREVN